jgi:D-alanyl-lipoteichoic acid acyltransferase DltB (MBOAT superfamily)
MLFNSLDFAIFLPIVFILYWFVFQKSIKLQNLLILIASYVFYGWWDWRFLGLLAFSSIIDYLIGIKLTTETIPSKRKLYLWLSISVNLGLLGFFKYFNFFAENFHHAFSLLGYQFPLSSLNIVLPVGISFYTFQTLSYTIDVYKGKLQPSKDLISFLAFVSFFPQLVAGPIERAANLLPQFFIPRKFEYANAVNGMRQILWGLFKKVVIADNCAEAVNVIFANSASLYGNELFLGAIFFSFQIYGDFSGYSDIAIGTSRLFGFNLMKNFAFPYFSRDIAEFWRRWHISLSTWFRDYLYIPLGGSLGNFWQKIRNTFIIFLVSGFWHGANWTFIAWGAIHAFFFLPLLVLGKNRRFLNNLNQNKFFPSFREFYSIIFTFLGVTIAWIFFRAENIQQATLYILNMFKHPGSFLLFNVYLKYLFLLIIIPLFLLAEWQGKHKEYAIESLPDKMPKPLRYTFYYILGAIIIWFGDKEVQFIYFQF